MAKLVKSIYTGSDVTSLGEVTPTDSIEDAYKWSGSQRGVVVTDNDGSFDLNAGNNFGCTPAGAITLTFTNIPSDSQSGFIKLDNTGGQVISAAATTKVDASILATLSTAGVYMVSYYADGTNVYLTNSLVYT